MKYFVYIILLLPSINVFATTIKSYVDRNRISIDDSLTLSIEISGAEDGGGVDIGDIPGFKVESTGTSSSVQIINGKMNASYTSNFVLIPEKIGTLKIPSFSFDFQSKQYTTDPITITVTKGEAFESTDIADSGDLVLLQEVSNKNPMVNEAVLYTVRFLRKVQIDGARFVENPKLGEFLTEDVGKDVEYTTVTNGERYQVYEIKKIIFPLGPGTVTIPPVVIKGNLLGRSKRQGNSFFDSFFDSSFSRIPKTIRSQPVTLHIAPLPEPRPSDFSGFVGKLHMQFSHDKDSVAVGDSVNIKIIVQGEGNLRSLEISKPKESEDYKIYADKPSLDIKTNDGKLEGIKIFTYALVPSKPGTITMGETKVSYFDTTEKKYISLNHDPITISVLETGSLHEKIAEEETKDEHEKRDVSYIGKDIFSIHTEEALLTTQVVSKRDLYFYIILFGIPHILSILGILFIQKRRNEDKNSDCLRKKNAYKHAVRSTAQIPSTFVDYGKILKVYCGEMFGLSIRMGTSLTHHEIIEKLTTLSIEKNLLGQISFILESCEKVHYGLLSDSEHALDRNKFIVLLKQLDKKLKNIEPSN